MEKLKALCVVAHPDDCVIFARPFIENNSSEYEWTILYLTYNETDDRAQEMQRYWSQHSINTIFLGHVDDYRDIENQKISFSKLQAEWQIVGHSRNYDLILTHAADGDYGHIHHKFVHSCVAPIRGPKKVYFSSKQSATLRFETENSLDLTQLPLHRTVISEFENINIGWYTYG